MRSPPRDGLSSSSQASEAHAAPMLAPEPAAPEESPREPSARPAGVRNSGVHATPRLAFLQPEAAEAERYFGSLNLAQRILWCYLLWYLQVVVLYFDPSPILWLSSVGLSAIIGTGLYLSTARAGRVPTRLDRWQIARLYAMPFCVSSFAALIKDHGFLLIFHPTLGGNLQAAGFCLAFVGLCELVKRA